jgi:hypothetical protein
VYKGIFHKQLKKYLVLAMVAALNPIVILDGYLSTMIGIALANVWAALNDQGWRVIDNFVSLTEKDVEQICTNVRKLGDTINNSTILTIMGTCLWPGFL